jgi:hypothetical protein
MRWLYHIEGWAALRLWEGESDFSFFDRAARLEERGGGGEDVEISYSQENGSFLGDLRVLCG